MQGIWLGGLVLGVACWLIGGLGCGLAAGSRRANRTGLSAGLIGQALEVSLLVGLALVASGLVAWLWSGGPTSSSGAAAWTVRLGGWTVLAMDGLSWVLTLLVCFLGWVVVRYSRHYLAEDAQQASATGWLAATLAAVIGMIVSGNLLLLLGWWTLASLTLQQLLLFHAERPLARRAASTKFVFSRFADLCLYAGGALLFWRAGTWEFEGLKTWAAALNSVDLWWIGPACVLLALGAATRSAQVPFHFWLPLTLDTPTPVSALMHAGIVNAGGFMAIRLSFLLVESPLALNMLAGMGLLTALLAGLVMMTQSSIKSQLAWSTVAQMGFMMLQCGCGAFSAALLHLVAHSLYKAHAFLASGSVLGESALLEPRLFNGRPPSRGGFALALVLATGLVLGSFWAVGVSLWQKPGGTMLAGALSCGIAFWLQGLLRLPEPMRSRPRVWLRGLANALGLVAVYLCVWLVCDWLLQPPVPQRLGFASPQAGLLIWGLLFAGLVGLGGDWQRVAGHPRLEAWRVHASQGFYLESVMRRWLGGVARGISG